MKTASVRLRPLARSARAWVTGFLIATALEPGGGSRVQAQRVSPSGDPAELPAVISAPRLERCFANRGAACLGVSISVAPAQAHAVAAGERGGDSTRWRVRVGEATLGAPFIQVGLESHPPFRLLVLVDVSGSMRDGTMRLTLAELDAFIRTLPMESVRVAVAPFSARGVAEGIRNAPFTDRDHAREAISRLPPPDGNTGLYSAVQTAAETVADAVRQAPGAWGAVLLVTDGKNSVGHRGDDVDLLDGEVGRRLAEVTVRTSGVHLFAIGIGSEPSAEELSALASARGESYLVARNAEALRGALDDVSGWLRTTRVLTVPLSVSERARFTRAAQVTVEYASPSGSRELRAMASWSPPLVALPPLVGVAEPNAIREAIAGVSFAAPPRATIAAVLALLLVATSAAIPRLTLRDRLLDNGGTVALTGRVVSVREPSVRTASGVGSLPGTAPGRSPISSASSLAQPSSQHGPAVVIGGMRRDLVEAPPRRPSDVTAPGD